MNLSIKSICMLCCLWLTVATTLRAAPIIVTSNAILNTNASADYVEVYTGGTLTISNCTLEIDQLGTITVYPGGKLILNNCTITVETVATSPNYWKGIQVLGDFSQAQTPADQGILEINNGTIIEKALVAVNVGIRRYTDYSDVKPTDYYAEGGGIVTGRNATIRNCRYAVVFNPYYDPNVITSPDGNLSTFTGMHFYWDINAEATLCTENDGERFKNLVELHQVHDVQFVGCTFGSYRHWENWWGGTGNGNKLERYAAGRGFGIEAVGSSFYVRSKGPCGTVGNTSCDECTGDPCKFEGLAVGIHVDGFKNNTGYYSGYPNNSMTRHVDISGALFLNDQYGFIAYRLSSEGAFTPTSTLTNFDWQYYPIENIFINRCTFKTDGNIYNYHYKCLPKNIALNYCKHVEISDNLFDINVPDTLSQPGDDTACFTTFSPSVYIFNCPSDIVLYRNTFHSKMGVNEHCQRQFYFNEFRGKNPDLKIRCNTYDWDTTTSGTDAISIDMDFEMDNTGGSGSSRFLLSNQGSSTEDAGNRFTMRPLHVDVSTTVFHGANKGNQYSSPFGPLENTFNYYYDSTDIRKKPRFFEDTFITQKFKVFKTGNTAACAETDICNYYNPNVNNTTTTGGGGTPNNPYILNASPNPGGGETTIEVTTELGTVEINGTITITDAEGNLITGMVIINNTNPYYVFTYDFSGQPSGFYYITYNDGNGHIVTIIFYKP